MKTAYRRLLIVVVLAAAVDPASAQTITRAQTGGAAIPIPSLSPTLGLGSSLTLRPGLRTGLSAPPVFLSPIVRAAVARAAVPVLAAPQDALSQAASMIEKEKPGAGSAPAADNTGRVFDGSTPMSRPSVESWTVDGKTYKSTSELVKALPDSTRPLNAVYTFGHTTAVPPKARTANTAVGAATGGVVGTAAAVFLTALGAILGPVLDVMTGGYGAGPGLSQMLVFAGVFGGGGALMGAIIGFEESAKAAPETTNIPGKLYRHAGPEGTKLYFETTGGKQAIIDLDAYAQSSPLPAPAPTAPWPAWKRAAAGLAVGAGLAVSQWIPLVQIFTLPVAGLAVGAEVGSALAAGTGIKGGILGGALGLFVPAAAFASFAAVPSLGILGSLGVFVAVFAALGAVIGFFAADAVRAKSGRDAARNPPEQWWAGRS